MNNNKQSEYTYNLDSKVSYNTALASFVNLGVMNVRQPHPGADFKENKHFRFAVEAIKMMFNFRDEEAVIADLEAKYQEMQKVPGI